MKHLMAIVLAIATPASAWAKLSIVTTTEDLASIATTIAGDKAEVTAICKGYQDPHFVDPKPSYLLKLRTADLLIAVGLELEVGWLTSLVQQCRNPKLLGTGYLDVSQGCEILERPAGAVSRAEGDVHPLGNPHYWLEPENGRAIARSIAAKLSSLQPNDAAFFQGRLDSFLKQLDQKTAEWVEMMRPYAGAEIVTYHNSWPNFAKRFNLRVAGYVEPKPGVPPSPAHTLELIRTMRERGIKVILIEPYFDLQTPNAIARETGARVVVMPPSVGGNDQIKDYIGLFDYDLALLTKAFAETGYKPPRPAA
ncbi:MAG: metal ABC transporter substrate-binding protein [Acidobacteriota bacterium]